MPHPMFISVEDYEATQTLTNALKILEKRVKFLVDKITRLEIINQKQKETIEELNYLKED